MGREIFDLTTKTSNGQSTLFRRDTLAKYIDAVADRVQRPRVLAVASGHLREAKLSRALQSGCVGEVVALDQDAESLRVVSTDYPQLPITIVCDSVASVLAGKLSLSDFDLIYSAGLLDYLTEGVATRLVTRLFGMLNSDGTLLIANFMSKSFGRGYMEAFMNWHLVYRDETELRRLARKLSTNTFTSREFNDPYRNVTYLEISRSQLSTTDADRLNA